MANLDIKNHPCFNAEASKTFARVHLPVAADCNIQCNFCNRKYDCINESRPGVTAALLSPEQSIFYLERIMSRKPNISVVGIAGPGEPFANPEATLKALRLVKEKFPHLILCVATNGLNIFVYINELKKIGVSHVTVTVNAVEPEIGAKIYSWVRFAKQIYRGIEAAKILAHLQIEAIRELKRLGFIVKVNTIIIPGINDTHIVEVARKASKLGVDILNCIPLYPSKDTLFGYIGEPDTGMVAGIHKQAEPYIKQMYHCRRCRADSVGLLGEESTDEDISYLNECSQMPLNPYEERPCIAVASREGALINQHLGEAEEFRVFKKTGDKFKLSEIRKAPLPGSGVKRWLELADVLSDCSMVLVSNVGHMPREILNLKGIRVIEAEGIIEDILYRISEGVEIESLEKKWEGGCSGGNRGCG